MGGVFATLVLVRRFSPPAKYLILTGTIAAISAGCGGIYQRNLPPAGIQQASEGLPATLTPALQAHEQWLASTAAHTEPSELLSRREALRPRMPTGANVDTNATLAANRILTGYFREVEVEKRRSKRAQPQICIALSGGGIRAAAFGIGVLQGLHESGKLRDVDIVSAVSGGAYSLAWYTQYRLRGVADEELLSDEFIQSKVKPTLFRLPVAVLGAATTPLSVLMGSSRHANGIDSSTLSSSYYGMLGTSFGMSMFNPLTWSKMRKAVEDGAIPLPIVGIAAYPLPTHVDRLDTPEQSLTSRAKSVALYDTYLEVTPYRYGVYGFGFHEDPLTPISDDVWNYVQISGAAWDRPHDPQSIERLASGLRLGGTLSFIVAKQYPSSQPVQRVDDVVRHFFYATDGGFAENLAAFPLVLRRCETIVIADSEHDPEWVMEGYRVLKHRLAAEHGLQLTIRELDELSYPPHAEVKPFERADGLKLLTTARECARSADEPACGARAAPKTVFYGSATMIPLSDAELAVGSKSRVIYLKLGMKRAALQGDAPDSVKVLMQKCLATPQTCHFPQDPTFDRAEPTRSQQYTAEQFKAYKDLARQMAKDITW